jgi:biotin carboxylase
MARALDETVVTGIPTTLALLGNICEEPEFAAGRYTTAYLTARAEALPALGAPRAA